MSLARFERGALAVPVEGQLPAGAARGKKYSRPIAEEAAQRIETLGGGGFNLNHGRGGNTCVRGNVLEYVCTARAVDAGYWLGAAAVPALLASVTGLSNVGIVWLLSLTAPATGTDSGLLLGAIALMPVAMLGGVCLGIFAAGLGLYLSDPYMGSNFLSIILPVSAGVIVPVSTYPAWLAWVCSWVPGSRLVQALDASGGIANSTAPDLFALLAADTALALLYAAIGLGLTFLAARRIRAGARASLL